MASPSAPTSVLLPADLKARLQRQAKKRALKLSTAIKVLLEERLKELEADEGLRRAEEWQRAQVWGSWDRYKRGENEEVEWDELHAVFEAATPSGPRKTSPATSPRRSRG